MDYGNEILKQAYKHSLNHSEEINGSTSCGCFYCLEIFMPDEIWEWVPGEETAFCPRCWIDAVIGDRSGFPVNDRAFLRALRTMYFKDLD